MFPVKPPVAAANQGDCDRDVCVFHVKHEFLVHTCGLRADTRVGRSNVHGGTCALGQVAVGPAHPT